MNFSPKSGVTSARLFAAIKDTLLVKGALSPTLLVVVSDKMLIVGGLNNSTMVVLLSDNISTKEGLTILGLSGGSDVIAVVLGAIDYNTVLSEY